MNETFLRLQQAFASLGYAVKWWYKGPGNNTHTLTPPSDYGREKPMCFTFNGGCIRCARAALARATLGNEKYSGLAG